jgi:hypothetical protein
MSCIAFSSPLRSSSRGALPRLRSLSCIPLSMQATVCAKCSEGLKKNPPGTWGTGWVCDSPEHQGSNRFTKEDCVWGCSTVLQCNWGLCGVCWRREQAKKKARAHTEGGAPPYCGKCSEGLSEQSPGTWGTGWGCDSAEHQGPNRFMREDCVWGCPTVMECDWGLCGNCNEREQAKHVEKVH